MGDGLEGLQDKERNLSFINYSCNCRELFIFTFALLNKGVPPVKIVYFVSIEQKNKNYLQKLPGVLRTKDEVFRSANKQLGKLVNAYVMIFIENNNRKQKRNKRKKSLPLSLLLGYYLKQRSVLPVSLIFCRPDSLCFSRRILSHFFSIAWLFLSRQEQWTNNEGRWQ